MKTLKFLSVLSVCVSIGMIVTHPGAAEDSAPSVLEKHDVSVDEDKGALAKALSGNEEEGVVEFFVKKSTFGPNETAYMPDDLNEISPAAGVQFRMEF